MNEPAKGLRPSLGWDQICAERTKILSTFDHARTHSRSHEVEVYHGHVAQSEVRRWLSDFLPKKYGVTSGYVISTGLSSDDDNPHFDVIIYDQLNSPVLWVEEHPGMGDHGKSLAIPVEYVLCVLEVKSRLSLQTARHAIEHLGDLLPLMQNIDQPEQRYKKFLPSNFSCGAVFVDLMKKDANSDAMLEALVDGAKLRGFFGGLVLRQEGLVSATRPAIMVGTTEIYRTSLGGDIRQDQNPLAPIFTKDEDVFVGFVNPQTALLSWGIPEATLRELLATRAAEGNADSKATFQADRDALRQQILVARGPIPLPDDGAISTPVRMTLTADFVEELRFDWQFECKTVRHAAQVEQTAKASIDQAKATASLFLAALGKRGQLFDELVAHVKLQRESRFLQFSMRAPMALLHLWANDSPTSLAYLDADGEEVERRQDAKYVFLNCTTEGRVADDLFPALPDHQFGGAYYRQRRECFGIDDSRQPFPRNADRTAITMMTYWALDQASNKLRVAAYERRGADKNPACDETGTSKKVLVCDFGAGGEPTDAVYFDGNGKRCAVRVVVDDIVPDSQAARVGLKTGDQLVSIGGMAVTSVEKLRQVLTQPAPQGEKTAPAELTLVVLREKSERQFVVQRKLLGAILSISAIRSE